MFTAPPTSFSTLFARQRNLRHQAGTSLVLPIILDVGVVSESENIEASLSRKGIYGIDEQEILRGFQVAISQPAPRPDQPVPVMGDSQIILGLEPSELAKAIAACETVDIYWYNDACLCRLCAEMERAAITTEPEGQGGDFKKTLKAVSAESFGAAVEAIAQRIMKRALRIVSPDLIKTIVQSRDKSNEKEKPR